LNLTKNTSSLFIALAAAAALCSNAHAAPVLTQAGYTAASIATLPGPNSNIFGSISVDAAGNRYVVGGYTQSLYKVDSNGAVTAFANPPNGNALLGATVVGNSLYLGSESSVFSRVDLTTGAITNLATSMGSIQSMAFGAGKLYVGTTSGVHAYNIATNTFTATSITGSYATSMAFGNDGRLLVGDYTNSRILSYDTATNTSTVFRTGLQNIGGLAVHEPTGLVYAALEGSSQLMEIAADGSAATVFASSHPIDGGYYPTALAFSQDASQLYYLDRVAGSSNTFQLAAISGFSATTGNSVPTPGALSLVLLGLVMAGAVRRRSAA
jgi:MYXO-CTERM domain-containing protein